MKRILFFVSLLILSGTLKSQTTLISEGFETLPYKFTSSLTGGVPHWKATSNYHYSGLKADSCAVISGANTMFLLSDTFNTDGKQFVLLEFVHIAKIDYMDRAEIEISINGGNWTKLTNTMYLGGSSVFGIYNDRFDSRSYSEWDFTNNSLLPASNWWKKEVFDISSVAKDTNNVALRFRLTDGGTLGSSGAYGWLIDDVKISVAVVENIPPSISLNSPILQDSVFSTGPFNINATITDASGIASAKVFYKLGLGNWDSIAMTHVGSLYNAPIPSYPYGTNITYYVWAKDAVGNTNTTVQKSFLIKQPDVEVSVIDIYTGNTYFPTSSNYGYKRDGQLLFQSEINKFGLIKALQWRVATVSSVDLPIKIYLKSINATSLLTDNWNNIISSATLVFDGTVNFPDTGWRKIIFQNQFNYTSDNLLILTETNLGGTGLAPYANFYYNISGSNNHLYYYDDNNPPNSINLYLNANRSNIKLGFTPSNYNIDAGISQITSPTSMVLANLAMDIKVILRNFGTTPLNSVKIRYAIDGGIASSPIAWNGNLLQDIYLPQFAIDNPSFQPGQHTLKVWTELPNNLSDMNNLNDTATISFYACSSLFNGSYTIGGVGADYPDFSSAVNALNNCGIMGPTIFNVNAGTYNERIILPPISGSSPTNTITFQSANGDNTSVVLTDSSTSTADNYIIKFVGADYVTIKKITIYNKGISYAKNIDISGGSSNNRIIDNIFLAPVTNNASTNIAHIYSINGTTSIDSNNWIMNNQFINGSVGIYWGGGNASNLESGTRIINNVFTDMYYQGMYLIYQNAPEVTGNTINTTTLYSG